MKKDYKSKTLFVFSGLTKGEFIQGKIKRLISTEKDNEIFFWVDGDRKISHFLEAFDKSQTTPVFGKIDNIGTKKDDWVVCVATVNAVVPISEYPYLLSFDSQIVQNYQNQGHTVALHYYTPLFNKTYVLENTSLFIPEKPEIKEWVYTGGLWATTVYFSPYEEGMPDAAKISYYHVEDIASQVDINYAPVEFTINDSAENNTVLLPKNYKYSAEEEAPSLPFYIRLTRPPKASRDIKEIATVYEIDIKYMFPELENEGITDDKLKEWHYINKNLTSRYYLKEKQHIHFAPIYTSFPFQKTINGTVVKVVAEIIRCRVFDYDRTKL